MPTDRALLVEGLDFPGGDLSQILDTTLEGCIAACRANDACTAFTFNGRAGACFPKGGSGAGQGASAPYAGAISGLLRPTPPEVIALARSRAAALDFLAPEDLAAARDQAVELARITRLPAAEVAALAGGAAPAGRDAQIVVSDDAGLWAARARDLLAVETDDYDRRNRLQAAALSSAVNAYLRAGPAPLQAEALQVLAQALIAADRGRAAIPALRLAQAAAPSAETAAALEDAIGKYGFRITENEVNADTARPQICASFSEGLVQAGVDYATYLRLPDSTLAVQATDRQICVAGVTHGQRYTITFRAGLPAASGETLAKDVEITAYVRDRSPAVSFPGRAYVLPRIAGSGLPIETVNTARLALSLARVSDRNLVAALRDDWFARPLAAYQAQEFSEQMGQQVWQGTAEVTHPLNQSVTTRLPMDEALAGQGPGLYVLQARLPDTDPDEQPAAMQWFIVSDLGISSFGGGQGLDVWVRSLADVSAKAGVEVALVSRANAVLGTARADAEGHVQFPSGLTQGTSGAEPALVTVRAEDDFAFLPLTDPEFDLSDRGVEGREAAPPIDVFLTTDRGAYRAGEVIHAVALARDPQAKALVGLPLTLRLLRPDGVEHARLPAPDLGAGGHVVDLPIAGSAPRGTWRLEVLADPKAPPLASTTLLVEDFLPERIDFDLKLPEAVLTLGTRPQLGVEARFLYGAPGADLAIEGDLRLAAATSLPGFDGYRFGRADQPFEAQFQSLDTPARTDAAGAATVAVSFPDLADLDRPLDARLALRLAEGSGRPVERRLTRPLLPAHPVPGIRPAFAGDSLRENETAAFDLMAAGPDGKPAAAQVHWRINRVETEYQWYALYGDWNWEPVTTRTVVAEGDATLSPEGPVRVAAPTTWGSYEIVVETTAGGYGAASTAFTAGWYAASAETTTPDRLEAALDKPAYRPGEVAKLRIVPQAAGVALVTVSAERLIESRVVPVKPGAQEIALEVTDAWGTGAYVTATALRPLEGAAPGTHLPVRALGLAHAAIDPGARALKTSIEAAPEADPRGPLPVAVKVEGVASGETAWVTLAAVDQGILNLTGFRDPDPQGRYFGQRKLGLALRDAYGRLIEGQTGLPGVVRSGGDAGNAARLQAPPPTEELVAYFSGPLQVGPDGYARTSFDLPAFNGKVRLMALAWSQGGVGQAGADVLVRDPVVVNAALPRFLAPGDESRLLIELAHASGPAGPMALEVTAEGATLGPVPAEVTLAEGGRLALPVTLSATSPGLAQVRVALTTPAGRRLEKVLSLPVSANDPLVSRQSRFELAAGGTFSFSADVFDGLVPGTGSATLAAGPIARLNAPGLLQMLDTYPWGCTEQLTSKAMPLLYLSSVAEALSGQAPADVAARIDATIARLLINQSANGAFGLWGPGSGDLWLDAYVTDFLSRARSAGHAVPDVAFRNALDNLRNRLNYAPDFDSEAGPYAYAMLVLAREGAAAIGDLRYNADARPGAFDTPIAAAQLGAALAAYGEQQRADAMFARAQAMLAEAPREEAQLWRADYGTGLRDRAAVLALAAEAGSQAVDAPSLGAELGRDIASRQLSTQEAAWTLLAAHALLEAPAAGRLTLDGTPVAGPLVRLLQDQGGGAAPQAIGNAGPTAATLTLTTFGVPASPEPAGGRGWAIARSWYDLEGQPVDPGRVAQGARLVTVLEVTPLDGGAARLMVTDPLPAGFEIDNPNLLSAGDISAFDWLDTAPVAHVEFRQDRFLAALERSDAEAGSFRLAYVVRAVSPGTFHQPAASVEDMYRPDFRAWTDSGTVTVAP